MSQTEIATAPGSRFRHRSPAIDTIRRCPSSGSVLPQPVRTMPRPPHAARLAVLGALVLLHASAPASAATYCVGTVAELRSALTAAQAAGDDEIRIRTGSYAVDSTLIYNSTLPGWLVIGGGYMEGGGLPCGARSLNAGSTVLDGQGLRQIMILAHQPPAGTTSSTRMVVDNLSFANGVGSGFQRGGGLNVFLLPDSAVNELWLENLVFRGNSGYFAGGLNASVANGMIRLVNSLFDSNSAPDSVFGHAALGVSASPPAYDNAIVVANSTFARGSCLGNTGGPRGCGLSIFTGTGLSAAIANSVFHDNAIADLTTQITAPTGTERVTVSDSLMPVDIGNLPRTIERALTGDPRFVDVTAGNFTPREDSALIDRGMLPIPGAYPQFNGFDVAGGFRNRFGGIDVGALERQSVDRVFADGFESLSP
jgi:hypothetical protein